MLNSENYASTTNTSFSWFLLKRINPFKFIISQKIIKWQE